MKRAWLLYFAFVINATLILYVMFSNKIPLPSLMKSPNILYNTSVQEFLSHLRPLQPIIIDISLVECLINQSSCSKVEENRLIRFGLPIDQWERVQQFNNISLTFQNDEHVVLRFYSTDFVLSKMIPVDQYFIVPGFANFSLKSLRLPVAKFVEYSFGQRNASVMENLELLLRFMKNPFVECRKDLAEKIRIENPELYEEKNVVIKNSYVETLHAFAEFGYSIGVYPMFIGGTLLGWYRECGFIPHTTDVDFMVFESEIGYKQVLQYELINNTTPQCKFTHKLGFMNKSHHAYLELVLHCAQIKIDVFVSYNGKNVTWQGGLGVRWVFPLIKEDEVCTAALLGRLFFVPCQVEPILVANYGPDWHIIHHSSNYSWDQSPINIEKL